MRRSNFGAATTVNGSDRSDKRGETVSIDESNVCGGLVRKFLPTLPRAFNSLLETPISVEGDEPWQLVKLLGNLLGIVDYATNMASFWFLDTLALYVVRHRGDLDEYCTSVLISWLAGEIRLLRGNQFTGQYSHAFVHRKHTREDFFREMRGIFAVAADKMSELNRVPYWEEMVDESREGTEETSSTDGQSMRSSRQHKSQGDVRFSSNVDPALVLDVVIEDTYDMYANELRYALIYAVFVEPIEIQSCDLPFTLRTPRPIKLADPMATPFIVQLQKSLRMVGATEKSKGNSGKGKKVKAIPEVPPTPPRSLDDEEQLMYNRSFILPLIEANESSGIFQTSDA